MVRIVGSWGQTVSKSSKQATSWVCGPDFETDEGMLGNEVGPGHTESCNDHIGSERIPRVYGVCRTPHKELDILRT